MTRRKRFDEFDDDVRVTDPRGLPIRGRTAYERAALAEAAGCARPGRSSGTPSAGPPPWHLYRFTFHTAVGVAGAEPFGATRWRFER